jgi:EAL domain-containing protein (putative c-di-GMP-specific phosphodiesterase class I)
LGDRGLIDPVGEWALHSACAKLQGWRDAVLYRGRIAVNLLGQQIERSDIIATVR